MALTRKQKIRALNARLDSPVVPGSGLTRRDLAHQREAATTLRFGDEDRAVKENVAAAGQRERDVTGWYDEYLKEVEGSRARIAGYQQGARDAVQGIQDSVRGLDAQGLQGMQSAAQSDAAVRGATVDPNLGKTASDASSVRQTLTGSFGAMLAAQQASANTYADERAHVVAPGQKLVAQRQAAGVTDQAKGRLSDVAAKKGAFREQFEGQARSDEAKNVLAAQALGLDIAKERNDVAIDRAQIKADRDATKAKDRAAGAKVNKYGYTEADWQALTVSARQKVIKDFSATGKTKADNKDTAERVTANRTLRGKLETAASRLGTIVGSLKDPGDPKAGKWSETEAVDAVAEKYFGGDRELARVALSLYRNNGVIGAEAAAILKARGVGVPKKWRRSRQRKTFEQVADAIKSFG